MSHYKANVRDIEFNLFEVFGRGDVYGTGPFAEIDVATARSILAEVAALAAGPVAETWAESDRTPPVYDPVAKTVTMPEGFTRAYRTWMDAEWWRLELPEHLGGTGAPPSLRWAAAEMPLGANPALHMYTSGPMFAATLDYLGTAEQKQLAGWMIEKRWGATMVLTEPDAGSDVGAGRTKAVPQPDGTWHITGVKRFITSGEHDLADNIVHLVLARPEGAGPGTKGLSLFAVPKHNVDLATGELTGRNGVYATNVEKKMGLKASTTCELTFGEHEPAVGTLVGDVHDGIAQMFNVIEYARMLVGTKAISTLSTGYLNALDYAKQRVQGPDLTQMLDKTAPRVTTIHHADVRRMLLLQKAYAEGMRALALYAATWQDSVTQLRAAGEETDVAERVNDLLLPLVKGVGSERAYEMLALSLQTLGGSGYLQDYPIEQYLRDAKIDTLYEGTTAIQGMDLFFRKIVRDQFQSLVIIANEITDFAKGDAGNGTLAVERDLLAKALEDAQGMLGAMTGFAMKSQQESAEIYKVGQNTTRLLLSLGDLVIGWLLLRQADVALTALKGEPSPADRDFYTGKVAVAKFFARSVLPRLSAERAIVEATDNAIMEIPESAF